MAVALADGVADPRAEVVERLYAAVCHRAVLRPERPHDLAADAKLAPVAGPKCRRIQLPADNLDQITVQHNVHLLPLCQQRTVEGSSRNLLLSR